MVRQIDSPVRWVEVVERMAADFGVEVFLEVGPGTVLCGLNRRIASADLTPWTRLPELRDHELAVRRPIHDALAIR